MLNYPIFFFGLPLPLFFACGSAGDLTLAGLPLFPLGGEARESLGLLAGLPLFRRGGVGGVAGGGVNTTLGAGDDAGGEVMSILETRVSDDGRRLSTNTIDIGGPAFLFLFS